MQYLDSVETTLTISGKKTHFVHITLHQSFNNHHRIEIKIDYQELESLWMENPTKIIQLISEEIGVTMKHKQTGATNIFSGIITDVSMNGIHGEQSYITITGCSPTIRLEGTPTMDSFTDLDLKTIVQEVVGTSGNGGEVTAKPVYSGSIDYICQYEETAHDFLNRLSWLYGDWYFYDGTTIHFGKPDPGTPAILVYDEDITNFDLRAKLIPPKVKRYEYLTHQVNEINSDAPESVDGVRGYIKIALDKSHEVYTSSAVRPLESSISSKKDLDDLVKVDKYRMVSQMLTMHAKTQTCRVKIGKLVSINLPKSMKVPLKHVETFLVTDLLHEIDQDGTYVNTFSAIPSEMENIPMQPVPAPKALPQVAWVKSNADPQGKGRVQVELQWQKQANKTTNWIRVQTPDGGSSEKVAKNRGFVFVPEEGDQVMVGFEHGDPNRPYITGAIFPENVSTGGGESNKGKSLTSRSGSTVTLDDNQGKGSVTISDPSGNVVVMDGAGNVTITAPKTMTLRAKDLKVIAGNSIEISSGGDGDGTIVIGAEKSIDASTTTEDITIEAKAGNISLTSTAKDLTLSADKGNFKVSSKETTMGSKADTKLSATGVFKINGASNVEINK